MNALIPFAYSGHNVRALTRDGAPWFVGRDVCAVLDIADARTSLNLLDEDERDSVPVIDSMGREQQTIVINEPGLYSLILRSRKPEAKAFKRWVTHEVLPAIRRTGGYQAPLSRRQLAENWADAERRAEIAEQRVETLAPAAASWSVLAEAAGDYSLRDAAHILDRDPSIRTGQNRLAAHLRAIGWCSQDGRPYQRHVEAGRLVARPVTFRHPSTGETTTTQLRITPKGLGELHRLMGGSAPLADRQLALVPA